MATQILVNLPIDVKMEIIDWLRCRHDFLHLAQTCRTFATIVLPRLYRFSVTHQGSECIFWAVTHKPAEGTSASLQDNRNVLQYAMRNGGDANVIFSLQGKARDTTPLHLAALNRMALIVYDLLKFGAKVNVANITKSDDNGLDDWLSLRFRRSLKDDIRDALKATKWLPMVFPMVQQQHDIVCLLFAGGAPPHLGISGKRELAKRPQESQAVTIYHFYAAMTHFDRLQKHHVEMYAALFQKHKEYVDTKIAGAGYAPLHIAVKNGNPTALKKLIKLGANVDVQCTLGRTPLMMAIQECTIHESVDSRRVMFEIIQFLLDCNANVSHTSHRVQETPLICVMEEPITYWSSAQCQCLVTIIDLLVEYGADLNQRSFGGKTLLHHVCLQLFHAKHTGGLKKILTHIMKKGADINMPLRGGMTMLRYCISNFMSVSPSHLRLMCQLGADIGEHEVEGVLAEWIDCRKMRHETQVSKVLKHHAEHISDSAAYEAYQKAFDQANVDLVGQLTAILPSPADASELVAIALSKPNLELLNMAVPLPFDANYTWKNGKSYLHIIVDKLTNEKLYKEDQAIDEATFFVKEGTSLAIKDKNGMDAIQMANKKRERHPMFVCMLYEARDKQRGIAGEEA
ncbi:hypothetical protein CDD81_3686 [Ophiocordyceps australis]|uniref:F-box domain-containing protein n=1 Tax=Ophiocordyceps australis TaxID=1399860 RepID=A0A2C5XPG0_9HYPO|nr:hypothetical protein CDD81_3686 [Ophiocordyceps australis]